MDCISSGVQADNIIGPDVQSNLVSSRHEKANDTGGNLYAIEELFCLSKHDMDLLDDDIMQCKRTENVI